MAQRRNHVGITSEVKQGQFCCGSVAEVEACAEDRRKVECLLYADFIARYDRPATLFYIDPPY